MHCRLLSVARLFLISVFISVLSACGGGGGSGGGATVSIPAAPASVAAAAASGQVTVSWNAVSGATSYNVYYATASGVTKTSGTQVVNAANPYIKTGLTNGTTYYFIVTAVNSAGESQASAQVSATPMATVTAPAAPTGVTATVGNAQNTLAWTAVTGATSYNIYWSNTSGVTTANGNRLTGVTNPYIHSGLTNGTAYYYVVTAMNAAGESPASAQVSATPTAASPAAPTGVTATAGNGQNSIAWNPVTGAASYNLYWSTTTGVTTVNGTKVTGAASPYLQTGLTNGTTYYYIVTAVNGGSESAASAQVSATPAATVAPPAAPTGLTAAGASGQVTLGWTAVTGATSYNLYYSTATGVTQATGTKVGGVTNPYILTGLTNGTPYYFIVTAVNAGGEGAASAQASATPAAPVTVPVAPTGVTATFGNAQNTVGWTAVTGATSYNVYWSTTSGVTPANGTKVVGAPNPFVQTGLTNGTAYYYVVTAVNSAGESPASTQVTATPLAPPAAPTGVTATGGNAQNTIAWNPVAGATSYNIYWSTTAGGSVITGATSPYVQTGLTNGTIYCYVVTAVGAGGESAASAAVCATPSALPAAPTGVTATAGNGQATVTWNAVTGATYYNIYASTTPGVTPVLANFVGVSTATGASTGSASITGLTDGTTYYFVVTAWNSAGESAVSNQASATPVAPAAPTGVTATAGNGQATVNWNTVTGATSYHLYYSTTAGVTPANGTLIANVTSPWTVTGLTNGATYYFVVTSVDSSGGESVASAQASATPAALGVPAAPTGVSATAGNGQFTPSWNAVTGATSYNLYWSTTSGTGMNGTKIANVTSGQAITATNGTTYYFVVTAVNSGGESAASAQVSAAPYDPAAVPQNLLLSKHGSYIRICLTDMSGGLASSWNVYRQTTPGVVIAAQNLVNFNGQIWAQGLASCLAGQWANDDYNSLVMGTTYYYKATSVINGVESAPSNEVSITY